MNQPTKPYSLSIRIQSICVTEMTVVVNTTRTEKTHRAERGKQNCQKAILVSAPGLSMTALIEKPALPYAIPSATSSPHRTDMALCRCWDFSACMDRRPRGLRF